jgi:ABC-type transport system substrate-binding protein
MDRAEHEAAWRELVHITNDWAATVPIVHPQTRTAVADYVRGFKVLPTANFRLQDVWLDK